MKDYIDVVSGFIDHDVKVIQEATSKPVPNSVKVKGKAKEIKKKGTGIKKVAKNGLKAVRGIEKDDIGFIIFILMLLLIPMMLIALCYDGYCNICEYQEVMEAHPGLDEAVHNYYAALNKKNGEDGIENGYISTQNTIFTKDVKGKDTMLVRIRSIQKVNKNSGTVTEQNWEGTWKCINGTWEPINFKMTNAHVAAQDDGN